MAFLEVEGVVWQVEEGAALRLSGARAIQMSSLILIKHIILHITANWAAFIILIPFLPHKRLPSRKNQRFLGLYRPRAHRGALGVASLERHEVGGVDAPLEF